MTRHTATDIIQNIATNGASPGPISVLPSTLLTSELGLLPDGASLWVVVVLPEFEDAGVSSGASLVQTSLYSRHISVNTM